MAYRPGEAPQRPARSTAVVVSTPEMESAAQLLHSKAIILTASVRRNDLTTDLVARAVAQDCNIPAERFQVSKFRVGCFLVRFDMSWHRDQAMDVGVVSCRGIALTMAPWQQASIRAVHHVWRFYCRVAVEGVALNFWNKDVMQTVPGSSVKVNVVEYRSEALDDAEVCYVWCWAWNPDDIPRSCDTSFLMRMGAAPPLRCSLPDGTPRDEGFEDTLEPLLIHLDSTKDFSPVERRTPSSRASGVPSSDESLVDAPVPTELFDWKLEVEDAMPRARRGAPDVHARLGPRRREDRDDDDDLPGCGGCRPRRPWRDALLDRLFAMATDSGLLTPVAGSIRCSLYADDVALFIKPTSEEISMTTAILQEFGDVSGLGLLEPASAADQALFVSMTEVTVGNGQTASFYSDSWAGEPLRMRWPLLYDVSRRKNRTVADAIRNDHWLLDLRGRVSPELLLDFITLREVVRSYTLAPNTEDIP
ncbi:hypothetical protein ACQ4PT_045600 [Festuca glaucescens]